MLVPILAALLMQAIPWEVPVQAPPMVPQTQEEMEAAEFEALWGAEDPPKYSAALPPLPASLVVPLDSPKYLEVPATLRVVSSDDIGDRPAPLKVKLANWQVSQPPSWAGLPPGVSVSYSNQGAESLKSLTGKVIKGVEIIQATICTDHPANVPGGRVYQQANSLGVQTISPKIGQRIVNNAVSLNWRSITIDVVMVGLGIASGLTVGGVVTASTGWQRGLTLSHLTADVLPKLFSHGAPDPSAFTDTILDGEKDLPFASPGCHLASLAGVYRKGAILLTPAIQLMP